MARRGLDPYSCAMRIDRLDTGGEGSLFVFRSRSGLVLLRLLALLALIFVGVSAVTRNVEWLFLAGTWGGAALLAWPIVRWMGWRDITLSLTSSTLRMLKNPESREPIRTVELEPGQPIEVAVGRVSVDRRGTKTKYYNVEHAGEILLSNLSSHYEAKQITKELNAAIAQ